MIRTYRTLLFLNSAVLALSLLWAVSIVPELGSRYGHPILKAAILIWPIPQVVLFWMAAKAKNRGDVADACWMLFGQLAIFAGIPAVLLALMVAAFPE